MEFIKAITASIAAKDTADFGLNDAWDNNVCYEIPIKSIDGIPVGSSVRKERMRNGKLRLWVKMWYNGRHKYYEYMSRGDDDRLEYDEEEVDRLWYASYDFTHEEQLVALSGSTDSLTDAVTKMIQDIRELSFCYWTGLLKTKKTMSGSDIDAWEGLLSSVASIKLQGDKCCVCYNGTMTTTECGHTLCFKCYTSLPCIEEQVGCPMCRQETALIRS